MTPLDALACEFLWIKRMQRTVQETVIYKYVKSYYLRKVKIEVQNQCIYETKQCHVLHLEAVTQRCSVKKVFSEISQNSQRNTCTRVSFLIRLNPLRTATLLKKRLWYRCFPVNFVTFLRTSFLTKHLRWLLLNIY